MAWVLALCMGVPVCAGAAQEQEVYGYPTEDALRKLPKTVTRGDFLEALASASGEDVSDSAWIDMEEYFTDGVEASDEVKWTFAKWILNGAAQDGEKAVLRLDDLITRQEAAALLGRYLDYRYTCLLYTSNRRKWRAKRGKCWERSTALRPRLERAKRTKANPACAMY